MVLPKALQDRKLVEWNFLVRGIVEMWEMASLVGLEGVLDDHLGRDIDGRLAENLGKLGNYLMLQRLSGRDRRARPQSAEPVEHPRTFQWSDEGIGAVISAAKLHFAANSNGSVAG